MNRERKIETEEVAGVPTPPRGRVTETFERKRDYLAGFLAGEKEEEPKGGAGSDLQASVVDVLKSIYDPEIPVDIYELGLIYGVTVAPEGAVHVRMTLTSPNCPAAQELPADVEQKVRAVPGVTDARVEIVFDPPWDSCKMSDAAKLQLGLL